MAAAIVALAYDRYVVQEMGAAARIHIASHFTLERHLGVITDVVEAAMTAPSGGLEAYE